MDYIIYPVKLLETRDFGGAARAFYFEKPQGFSWDEAAHMHLALPGFDEGGVRNKALIHHLSIITLPEEGRVGFLTRLDSSDSVYKKNAGRAENRRQRLSVQARQHPAPAARRAARGAAQHGRGRGRAAPPRAALR